LTTGITAHTPESVLLADNKSEHRISLIKERKEKRENKKEGRREHRISLIIERKNKRENTKDRRRGDRRRKEREREEREVENELENQNTKLSIIILCKIA